MSVTGCIPGFHAMLISYPTYARWCTTKEEHVPFLLANLSAAVCVIHWPQKALSWFLRVDT
jgi:hypothetical protein